MNKSIERFITVSTLLRNILIAHHAVAQSFALEAGEKNINMVYAIPVTSMLAPVLK